MLVMVDSHSLLKDHQKLIYSARITRMELSQLVTNPLSQVTILSISNLPTTMFQVHLSQPRSPVRARIDKQSALKDRERQSHSQRLDLSADLPSSCRVSLPWIWVQQ